MVRIGKLTSAGPDPASQDHYHPLPPRPTIHTDMKPVDYIGLYLIVIASSCVTVNILYRLYY